MLIYQLNVRFERAAMTIPFKKETMFQAFLTKWNEAYKEGKQMTIQGKNVGKILQLDQQKIVKPSSLSMKYKFNVPVFTFF